MRTKEQIITWINESRSSSSREIAVVELLADIRDTLIEELAAVKTLK